MTLIQCKLENSNESLPRTDAQIRLDEVWNRPEFRVRKIRYYNQITAKFFSEKVIKCDKTQIKTVLKECAGYPQLWYVAEKFINTGIITQNIIDSMWADENSDGLTFEEAEAISIR